VSIFSFFLLSSFYLSVRGHRVGVFFLLISCLSNLTIILLYFFNFLLLFGLDRVGVHAYTPPPRKKGKGGGGDIVFRSRIL